MKTKKIFDSFNYAFEGIIYTLRTQRNMRIHFIIAILVLFFSIFFDLSKMETIAVFITISLVIVTEMINTSIEATIDLITDKYHELAKIAKNVAAGAVLISAVNSIIVGYIVFFDKLDKLSTIFIHKVRNMPMNIVFVSLLIVIFIAIGIKAYFKEGTPLRGGMPSGHAAVSFSIFIAIAFLSQNTLIITLAFILALLVVQSRIESGIHSLIQVLVGSLLGALITLLIFNLVY
ncbi:diacylglycerol kinase [Maledivibacter halophilus]|uniref:Diacylglycerol kinase (ATP) n=1 Tax=Maledivibacter halophilus TaxID=36842 RepID=A0A1T5LUB8_9FIRM|nr:diacylglycerol kinase [Maledivibacter halophilus]SKC79570.1 diacylglycerol kinase (ATP) [Maledivibacter halophilus]